MDGWMDGRKQGRKEGRKQASKQASKEGRKEGRKEDKDTDRCATCIKIMQRLAGGRAPYPKSASRNLIITFCDKATKVDAKAHQLVSAAVCSAHLR